MKNQKTIKIIQEDDSEVSVKLSDFNLTLNMAADGIGHEAAPEGSLGHEAPGSNAEYEFNVKMKLDIKDKVGATIDNLLDFKKLIISK